jgi:predicted dehydrogenase
MPVRIAMLGCGGIAHRHVQLFKQNPDAQIVAMCDVSEDIVNALIDEQLADYPTRPEVFTDPAAMYDATKPDAVTILTPHTLHFEQATDALDRGMHVLLEKPMVTNADHAHALAAKVEQTGKVLSIAYNSPCTPEFQYLREQIRAGTFGRLHAISGWMTQNWKNLTVGKWRQVPELSGGGMAYDSGAHLLAGICWSVESPIAQVHAYVDNRGTPVDINASMNIRFANDATAALSIVGDCATNGCHLTFAFENGRADIDGWSGSWINVFKGKDRLKYPPIGAESYTPNDNFIDAILGKTVALTGPTIGIIQSELMDAIYESARTGHPATPKRRG